MAWGMTVADLRASIANAPDDARVVMIHEPNWVYGEVDEVSMMFRDPVGDGCRGEPEDNISESRDARFTDQCVVIVGGW